MLTKFAFRATAQTQLHESNASPSSRFFWQWLRLDRCSLPRQQKREPIQRISRMEP